MASHDIVIRGAREHNLRDVSVTLPRGALICLTGVSGSGKSSLAFDTLYAEGQRRYVESLSSYARQFLSQLPKPDVDRIDGLSPSIAIQQKTGGRNPRSTVGTITEIHDYLRVLFARIGQGHCPDCGQPIEAQTRDQILARALEMPAGTALTILAPVVRGQKGEHKDLFADLIRRGFVRARVDGRIANLADDLGLDRYVKHNIEVVVDRLKTSTTQSIRSRIADAVETALKTGGEMVILAIDGQSDILLSSQYACPACKISFEAPSPQLFSFNSPQGMCLGCDGLGVRHTFDPDLIVPDPSLSVASGAFAPLGPVTDMAKARRFLFEAVAAHVEGQKDGPPKGTMLKTRWKDLDPKLRKIWLNGLGSRRIVVRWSGRGQNYSYADVFKGVIHELTEKFQDAKTGAMTGRGVEQYLKTGLCPDCQGERLNPRARSVRVGGQSLPGLGQMSIGDVSAFFDALAAMPADAEAPQSAVAAPPLEAPPKAKTKAKAKAKAKSKSKAETEPNLESNPSPAAIVAPTPLSARSRMIAEELLKEIRGRLGFLIDVGLHYLTLDRGAPTLSGGEAQRIRLASQVGAGLVGILYILDEPSIGLHPRDNDRLIASLQRLRDQGNTVVVVEHDEDTMRAADYLIDFGPGPGVKGGEVVAVGTLDQIANAELSVTGQYLSGRREIPVPKTRKAPGDRKLKVVNARHHNLKGVTVEFPLGLFIAVTGVSGSGKSSLIGDILQSSLANTLNGAELEVGGHDRIEGTEHLDKIIDIDQSPIGRTPRSNPATYTKTFDQIRDLYAKLPDSKSRGYAPGRFSFNVEGGRCEACEGNGSNRLEMDFLADVWVNCPVCQGHRFNRETLQVRFKGKSINDVLNMDVQESLEHFSNIPRLAGMLKTLHDVGLDYIKLGQPSPTLSGGEAQRIKLARELAKRGTGKTIYVLDEPTTGLHFEDIRKLLDVLQSFAAAGNTVVVIEHNLDVIKTADWIIDLGPEGGAGGGRIIAQGTPEQVAACEESHTGRALRKILDPKARAKAIKSAKTPRSEKTKQKVQETPGTSRSISIRGAEQHNLKKVDLDVPRNQMSVCSGPSGSGKSSLAIDTLYAEGQRRYVESLSSYARQFLAPLQKPKVEQITGLSPAICIEQKTTGKSPRSTVGTVTEIHDYLRILFARLGKPHCPDCGVPIGTQTADEIIEKILHFPEGSKIFVMAPIERKDGESYGELWDRLRESGFARVRIDGASHNLDKPPALSDQRIHRLEVVVDRAVVKRSGRSRLADSIEAALDLGRGVLHIARMDESKAEGQWQVDRYSQHRSCEKCHRGFDELTPHHFSFNSPIGWCPLCQGLGVQQGANLAVLVPNDAKTIRQGAIIEFREIGKNSTLIAMFEAMGIDLDKPFRAMEPKQRRILLHGAGSQWFTIPAQGKRPEFSFQFKGLYPALDEVSRASTHYRYRLSTMVDEVDCVGCGGSRLREDASAVRFEGMTMEELGALPLGDAYRFFKALKLDRDAKHIAGDVIREVRDRLQFLVEVGLDYLTLGRGAPTLSGGESQRIRLASQIGSGLTGVLYVLDEPTIGLHPRDNTRLLGALKRLRDLGNTLVVVEHDREVIEAADCVFDFGPGSGDFGGRITASGAPDEIKGSQTSLTGDYLSGRKAIPAPTLRRKRVGRDAIVIKGARHNNLKNINVEFPVGLVTAVTGVSGSGKSSLVEDVLWKTLAKKLLRAKVTPGACDGIDGLKLINKVISVDQTPIGFTPSSTPATYAGAFDLIRELFARVPEARARGYSARKFSFNQPGGRCEACEGVGWKKIEMHFLPDVWVVCDNCQGSRYTSDALAIKYRDKSIADVLQMTVDSAVELFADVPKLSKVLRTLQDVGLGYISLGQSATTLSGGEAQRVKLAAELSRPDTGATLYVLDEPTTGLHLDDVRKLLTVIHRLADLGNTVVVIEHNLDVIKTADWVIDIGPEAGPQGGQVVATGTPEEIVKVKASLTGRTLKPILDASPREERAIYDPKAAAKIELERKRAMKAAAPADPPTGGSDVKAPWEVDGQRWHTEDRETRTGRKPNWDGAALIHVVNRLEAITKHKARWNQRTTVELGQAYTPFFKALTNHEWVLTLKFLWRERPPSPSVLQRQLRLIPFSKAEKPILCESPRVAVEESGLAYEITIRVHDFSEVSTPEFEAFLEKSAETFQSFPNSSEARSLVAQFLETLLGNGGKETGGKTTETPSSSSSKKTHGLRIVLEDDED